LVQERQQEYEKIMLIFFSAIIFFPENYAEKKSLNFTRFEKCLLHWDKNNKRVKLICLISKTFLFVFLLLKEKESGIDNQTSINLMYI
jgi:hypothetical protein